MVFLLVFPVQIWLLAEGPKRGACCFSLRDFDQRAPDTLRGEPWARSQRGALLSTKGPRWTNPAARRCTFCQQHTDGNFATPALEARPL